MNRRNFMQAILAAGTMPAICRASSLMRIVPRELIVVDSLEDYKRGMFNGIATNPSQRMAMYKYKNGVLIPRTLQ